MRRSPKRHPLAVLRLALGLSQKEMARLADCSVVTIQSIEIGRLPVSASLAKQVWMMTGVSRAWLRAGDPTQPMVTEEGRPYTTETFELFGSVLLSPGRFAEDRAGEDTSISAILATALLQLYCILRHSRNCGRLVLTGSKIQIAISDLIDRFGVDPEVARKLRAHEFDVTGDTLQQAVDFIRKAGVAPEPAINTTQQIKIVLKPKKH